jgi:uncharacterized protein (TIGR02246 family)
MSLEERLALLEERLRRAEDRLAIGDLIASYGPLVDAGDASGTAALWTEDGSYDVDTGRYDGRDGIADMVGSSAHQGLLGRGCAHVTTPPWVEVDGDRAVAVCHSQLVVRRQDGAGFDVLRATAHRFELVRTDRGWRISRRTGRLLDGGDAARQLLRTSSDLPSSGQVDR